jgi:hypothetical protein
VVQWLAELTFEEHMPAFVPLSAAQSKLWHSMNQSSKSSVKNPGSNQQSRL